jgi:hypothetical protein
MVTDLPDISEARNSGTCRKRNFRISRIVAVSDIELTYQQINFRKLGRSPKQAGSSGSF